MVFSRIARRTKPKEVATRARTQAINKRFSFCTMSVWVVVVDQLECGSSRIAQSEFKESCVANTVYPKGRIPCVGHQANDSFFGVSLSTAKLMGVILL